MCLILQTFGMLKLDKITFWTQHTAALYSKQLFVKITGKQALCLHDWKLNMSFRISTFKLAYLHLQEFLPFMPVIIPLPFFINALPSPPNQDAIWVSS